MMTCIIASARAASVPGFTINLSCAARQASLDPEGEYGRWLLDLPIAIKVNDVVFVHELQRVVETVELGQEGHAENEPRQIVFHPRPADHCRADPTDADIRELRRKLGQPLFDRCLVRRVLIVDSGAQRPVFGDGDGVVGPGSKGGRGFGESGRGRSAVPGRCT